MQNTHFKEPAIGGSIRREIVNPDLAEERAKCTFDKSEVEKVIYIDGMKEYYIRLAQDTAKYPEELKAPPTYLEMTREEQMKWHWTRLRKLMEINPKLYFHDVESGLQMPTAIVPGICPLTLHFGMFKACVQKLGSDE